MRYWLPALILLLLVAGVITLRNGDWRSVSEPQDQELPASSPSAFPLATPTPPSDTPQSMVEKRGFVPPLDRARERVTKKSFGLRVSPGNSPVQPERFSGYHTGTDFEIFPEETDAPVVVRAVCDGALLQKRAAGGYGGVAVQQCRLDDEPITVIYGHLRLASIGASVGETLTAGALLGVLGEGGSPETDGERKHLHLGFHRGTDINIRGYVADATLLAGWLDPCQFVCGR